MDYRGLTLDPFQEEAVEYIEDGHSVLVAAPTGTGKTLIADYLIEHILDDGGEVIYTAPVKALSNQKYREYTALFGRDKVGLVTGDLVINRDAPVRIMTTEILRNMLLEGGHGGVMEDVEPDEAPDEAELSDIEQTASPSDSHLPEIERLQAVIIDEIHFLDDPSRGTVWEELLIYLPTRIRILGLSATASNLEEVASWLTEIRETDVKVVRENERAVPLKIYMASLETGIVPVKKFNNLYKGGRGRGNGGKSTRHYHLFDMMQDWRFPALYFIFSRKLVEKLARGLARGDVGRKLSKMADTQAINEHLNAFEEEYPEVLSPRDKATLRKGIGWHHAGIHVALKALVEELYEARLLNVLYCTSTFALGINMPARTVVFDGLTKYNGVDVVPLTVREFMQMAGRAGRRGIDEVGDVIVRQDFDDYDEVQPLLGRLIAEESEPIESSFNLTFHSVVNLVARFDEEEIRSMLERSFRAFQARTEAERLGERIEDKRAENAAVEQQPEEALGPEAMQERRRSRRKLAALERELAERRRPRLWEDFQRKLQFLRTYDYLTAHNELEPPARILRHIKIEEIFLTELILAGHLEDLTPTELFGAMCGLVVSLPRRAKVRRPDDDKWWEVFANFEAVYESEVVVRAEDLVDSETVFTPEVMPLGERWARGDQLNDILDDIRNPTDMSGDLVGCFRRAKDMIGQLRDVYYSDAARRKELTRLIHRVSRDEVEVLD
ncbi:MAG: DEAD/DEAH box helicase [Persicimonas sp.]